MNSWIVGLLAVAIVTVVTIMTHKLLTDPADPWGILPPLGRETGWKHIGGGIRVYLEKGTPVMGVAWMNSKQVLHLHGRYSSYQSIDVPAGLTDEEVNQWALAVYKMDII